MCGIAGILTSDPAVDLQRSLEGMLRALRHRGPDGSVAGELRLESGWRVGLAHARLAILDTSSAGLQPMSSRNRNLWTVFNGEIYNHLDLRQSLGIDSWRTGTDTETILEAWNRHGEAALPQLRGMFGLCLVDVRQQRAWIIRDRVGIKPVYFARVSDSLILFASEMRSLLASGLVARRLNRRALSGQLTLGAAAPPWTLVEGIEKLYPAEIRTFDLSGPELKTTTRRYWRPPFTDRRHLGDAETAARIDNLRHEFEEAASNHLLSDVPVGVFLSGGIDSGAIVEAVTRRHPQVATFSIAFAEHEFDESRVAEKTARAFGAAHETLVLTPQQMLSWMRDAFSAYDSPSFDGINTWLISKVVREAGIKVALSGLGGDELFAGYSYHRLMHRLRNRVFRTIARATANGMTMLRRESIRSVKLALAASTANRVDQYLALRRVIDPGLVRRLLPEHRDEPLPSEHRLDLEQQTARLDPVNAFSLLDMQCYMLNTILCDSDQMSMAHGMELRVPFLDHCVVEAVAAIPGDVKLERTAVHRNKSLLLKVLERPLPEEVTAGVKKGFMFPWDRWLRNELRDFAVQGMENSRAIEAAGLTPAAVSGISDSFQSGDPHVRSTDILCVLTLLNWVEQNLLHDGGTVAFPPPVAYHQNLLTGSSTVASMGA
jgi:asparagine synthase (glutamine-hydrolysing)